MSHSFARALSAAIAIAAVAASGPVWAESLAPSRTTAFDRSHHEIFSPVEDGPLHYSSLHDAFGRLGPVSLPVGPITEESLRGVGTYVIAGAATELTADEVRALGDFVDRGGSLLVLLHIAPPVARLTESFGIVVSNYVLSERHDTIASNAQDFRVSNLAEHPITKGVSKIAVFGTWGLRAEGAAKTVAATTHDCFVDMNRNRVKDEPEPAGVFGVVAVAERGGGRVVVLADDAPFANKFLSEADNRVLLDNVVAWLTRTSTRR